MVNPFPWNKSRISQFVADHLRSQKRRRSLVVEAGFPTSLIDLLHKNRDRLKNSSSKKRRDRAPSQSQSQSISPSPPPPPSQSVSSVEVSSICDSVAAISLSCDLNQASVRNSSSEQGALMVILKLSLVMSLALATKTFVVGITASAIFLILFESVAKHVSKFLKPFPNLHISLKLFILRVSDFVRTKQKRLISQENRKFSDRPTRQLDNLILDSSDLVCNFETNIPSPEIQTARNDCNLGSQTEEIKSVKDEIHCLNAVSELKTRRSQRIKSKIKKLVPKNLRISKKKVEIENEVTMCEEEEEDEDRESSPSVKQEVDCSCDEPTTVAKVEETIIRQRNSGYLVVLLIVLSGLIGGKILALLLTISCCLIMKSAGILMKSSS